MIKTTKDIIRISQDEPIDIFKALGESESEELARVLNSREDTVNSSKVTWKTVKLSENESFGNLNMDGRNLVKVNGDNRYMVYGVLEAGDGEVDFINRSSGNRTRTIGIMGTRNGTYSIFDADRKIDDITGKEILIPGGSTGVEFRNTDLFGSSGTNVYMDTVGGSRKTVGRVLNMDDRAVESVTGININKTSSMLNKIVSETAYGTEAPRLLMRNFKSMLGENMYSETGKMISDFYLANKVNSYYSLDGDAVRDYQQLKIGGGFEMVEKLFSSRMDLDKNGVNMISEADDKNSKLYSVISKFDSNIKRASNTTDPQGDFRRLMENNKDIISHFGLEYGEYENGRLINKTDVGRVFVSDMDGNKIFFNKEYFEDFRQFRSSVADSMFDNNNKASLMHNIFGHGAMTDSAGGGIYEKLNAAMVGTDYSAKRMAVNAAMDHGRNNILQLSGFNSANELTQYVLERKGAHMDEQYAAGYDSMRAKVAGLLDGMVEDGELVNDKYDAAISDYIYNKFNSRKAKFQGVNYKGFGGIGVDEQTMSKIEAEVNTWANSSVNAYTETNADLYLKRMSDLESLDPYIMSRMENGQTFHTLGYIGKQSSVRTGKLTGVDSKMMHMLGYLNAQGQRYDQGADVMADATFGDSSLGRLIGGAGAHIDNMEYKRAKYLMNYKEGADFINHVKDVTGNTDAKFFQKQAMTLYAKSSVSNLDSNLFSRMTALSNVGAYDKEYVELGFNSINERGLKAIREAIGSDGFDAMMAGTLTDKNQQQEVLKILLGGNYKKLGNENDVASRIKALNTRIFEDGSAFDLSTEKGQIAYAQAVQGYDEALGGILKSGMIFADNEANATVFNPAMVHNGSYNNIKGGNMVYLDDVAFGNGGIKLGVKAMLLQNEGSKVQVGDIKATTMDTRNLIMFNGRAIDAVINNNTFNDKRAFTGSFLSSSLHTMYYHAARSGNLDDFHSNYMKNFNIEFGGKQYSAFDILGLEVDVKKGGYRFSDRNVRAALENLKGDGSDFAMSNPFHILHKSFADNLQAKLGVVIDDKASEYIGDQIATGLYSNYENFRKAKGLGNPYKIIYSDGGDLIASNYDNTGMSVIDKIKSASYMLLNPLHIMNEHRTFKDEEALRVGRLTTNVLAEQGAGHIADIFDNFIVNQNIEDYQKSQALFGIGRFSRDSNEYKNLFLGDGNKSRTIDISAIDEIYSGENAKTWMDSMPKVFKDLFNFNPRSNTYKGEAAITLTGFDESIGKDMAAISNRFNGYQNKLLSAPTLQAISEISWKKGTESEIGIKLNSMIDLADPDQYFSAANYKKEVVRSMMAQAKEFVEGSDPLIHIFRDTTDRELKETGRYMTINNNYDTYIQEFKNYFKNVKTFDEAETYKRAMVFKATGLGKESILEYDAYKAIKGKDNFAFVNRLSGNDSEFKRFFGYNIDMNVNFADELKKLEGEGGSIAAFIGLERAKASFIDEALSTGSFIGDKHRKLGSSMMQFRGNVLHSLMRFGKAGDAEAKLYGTGGATNVEGILNMVETFKQDYGFSQLQISQMQRAIETMGADGEDMSAVKTLIGMSSSFYGGNGANMKDVIEFGAYKNLPILLKNLAVDGNGNRVFNAQANMMENIMNSSFEIKGSAATINALKDAELLDYEAGANALSNIDSRIAEIDAGSHDASQAVKMQAYKNDLEKIRSYITSNKGRVGVSFSDLDGMSVEDKISLMRRNVNSAMHSELETAVNSKGIIKAGKSSIAGMQDAVNIKNGSTFVVFDLETNSADTASAEIMQVAAKKYVMKNGKLVETGSLERFYEAEKMSKGAEAVHGITPEKLQAKRIELDQVGKTTSRFVGTPEEKAAGLVSGVEEVEDFFKDADYVVGYNQKSFDIPVLRNSQVSEKITSKKNIDVIEAAAELYGDSPVFNSAGGNMKVTQYYTADKLGIAYDEDLLHDAMYDIGLTKDVFEKLYRKNKANLGKSEYSSEEIFSRISNLRERRNKLKNRSYGQDEYRIVDKELRSLEAEVSEVFSKYAGDTRKIHNAINNMGSLNDASIQDIVAEIDKVNGGISVTEHDKNNLIKRATNRLENSKRKITNFITGRSHIMGEAFNAKGSMERLTSATLKNSVAVTPKDGSSIITIASDMARKGMTDDQQVDFLKAVKLVWGEGHDDAVNKILKESDAVKRGEKLSQYLDNLMGVVITREGNFSLPESVGDIAKGSSYVEYVYSSRHPQQYLNSLFANRFVQVGEDDNISFLRNYFSSDSSVLKNKNSIAYIGLKSAGAMNMDYDGDRTQLLFISDEIGSEGVQKVMKTEMETTYKLNNLLSTRKLKGDDEFNTEYDALKKSYVKSLNEIEDLSNEQFVDVLKGARDRFDNKRYFMELDMRRIDKYVAGEMKKHDGIIDLLRNDNMTQAEFAKRVFSMSSDDRTAVLGNAYAMATGKRKAEIVKELKDASTQALAGLGTNVLYDKQRKLYKDIQAAADQLGSATGDEAKAIAMRLSGLVSSATKKSGGVIKFGNLSLGKNLYSSYAGQSRTGVVHDALTQYREVAQALNQPQKYKELISSLEVLIEQNGQSVDDFIKEFDAMASIKELSSMSIGFNKFTDVIEGVISSKLTGEGGADLSQKVVQIYQNLRSDMTSDVVSAGIDFDATKKIVDTLRKNMNVDDLEAITDEIVGSGNNLTINSIVETILGQRAGNSRGKEFNSMRRVLAFELAGEYYEDMNKYDFDKVLSSADDISNETLLRGISNVINAASTGLVEDISIKFKGFKQAYDNAAKGPYAKLFGKGKNFIDSMSGIGKKAFQGVRSNIFTFTKMENAESVLDAVENTAGEVVDNSVPLSSPIMKAAGSENYANQLEKPANWDSMEINRLKSELESIKNLLENERSRNAILESRSAKAANEVKAAANVVNKSAGSKVVNAAEVVMAEQDNLNGVKNAVEKGGDTVEKLMAKTKGNKGTLGIIAGVAVLGAALRIFQKSKPMVELDINQRQYEKSKGKLHRELGNYNINTNIRGFY